MRGQQPLLQKTLGVVDYVAVLDKMREFTNNRDEKTEDELWLVEHSPVFTQGQAGKEEHLLNASHIPVVKSDRGGQITYHGPGQLVVYPLLDLKRLKLGVRDYVSVLEASVVEFLSYYGIKAEPKKNAPGVYVDGKKIASLGIRVRKSCCFHGVAININMDLKPFLQINPCGYPGLQMVQLKDYLSENDSPDIESAGEQFAVILAKNLNMQLSIVEPA